MECISPQISAENDFEKKIMESSRYIVEHKNKHGRDYSFVEQTEKELIYRDSRGCSLLHTGKKEEDICYLLEFEERSKEPTGIFAVSIYRINDKPLWVYSCFFEEDIIDHARAEAARFFRSLRDSEKISL